MNERIKQLAEQAGVEYTITKVMFLTGEEEIQKFAELIIKECAKVVDRGDGEMSSMVETIWCNVCRDDILKHFGVEE